MLKDTIKKLRIQQGLSQDELAERVRDWTPERAAEVAKLAHREDLTLRESCLRLGYMTAEAFDAAYRPEKMV